VVAAVAVAASASVVVAALADVKTVTYRLFY